MLPEPDTLHQWPCSLPSAPTYSSGFHEPVGVVPVGGCDWSDRITPGDPVLNHSSTARSDEPCHGVKGTSAYEEVPLNETAVASPVPKGPATPWVTEL